MISGFSSFAFLLVVALASSLSAAEPAPVQEAPKGYRMIFRSTAGQISMPDEIDRKRRTYFVDLAKIGLKPHHTFGGPAGTRFRAVKYDPDAQVLLCQEVATGRLIILKMGKVVNLPEAP
jgi:hypothetical protein